MCIVIDGCGSLIHSTVDVVIVVVVVVGVCRCWLSVFVVVDPFDCYCWLLVFVVAGCRLFPLSLLVVGLS